ncbi:hypothetical protein EON66_09160 [archaeon]|nr:MAG: hypothetical protein EON66_09160 [archaeon]
MFPCADDEEYDGYDEDEDGGAMDDEVRRCNALLRDVPRSLKHTQRVLFAPCLSKHSVQTTTCVLCWLACVTCRMILHGKSAATL